MCWYKESQPSTPQTLLLWLGIKPDPPDHVCDSAPADQFDSGPLRSTEGSALHSQSKDRDGRLCGSSVALSSAAS